ncbi:hypothetical protein ACIRF8_15120 [Streptomyces sp. NPDC102406]|uniref:hypothetical protein n=1 Tax=Streptomyces sp. NPDC102406 TaxID=3366171 RepID=UPI003806FF55
MTNHSKEAERLLAAADTAITAALEKDLPIEDQQHAAVLTGILTNRALGHASLAAGQTTSADVSSLRHAIHTYRFALIRQVAEGLIYSLTDEAHRHALGLSKYLDSVDLNIDREVEAHIEEHVGSGYMADAYEAPSVRNAKRRTENPWGGTSTAPTEDVPF